MTIKKLPFADIIILRDDIAESIVHEGVELDVRMVVQYHDFLVANLKAPFSLLINKLHAYTYTFDAQKLLGTIPQINSMAVVAYRDTSRLSTQYLAKFPRRKNWNMEMFGDRQDALDWLIEQQAKVKPAVSKANQKDLRRLSL